jgi:hypothetical protein
MNVKFLENNFYADDQIEQMRTLLSEYWSDHLEGEVIAAILLTGNEGYDNLDKETLIQEFESVFGEDYFGED